MKKLTNNFLLLVFVLFASTQAFSQQIDSNLLKEFKWRNIGPANMSGRTVDVEGVESNPKIIYAGTATSGLWKTVNRGTTWENVFDDQDVVSIGDIAIYQKNPDILYVGTGEANNRNSSPWGGGMYRSDDAGKSWKHIGLTETRHIARVVIDPNDANTVYVAALGKLWADNAERGVFKTTNGGKSWEKILFINDQTGITDLVMDPNNNKVFYAAAYERQRDGFSNGDPIKRWGPGSGIYVSKDSGKNWDKISKGLPTNEMGRIGLSASVSKAGVVYAEIETEKTPSFGQGNTRKGQKPDVNKGGIYLSTDYGKSWKIVNNYNSRPFYYSQIRVDPNDHNTIWMGGTALGRSKDGGKTVQAGASLSGPTHIDYHAIWINPNDSEHVLLGSDGGISVTYDDGKTWDMYVQMPMAQFYAITADMRKPYHVYGGLQDNGSWGGPSQTRSRYGIRNEDWYMISWGDGFYAQVDPTDVNIVYTESQGGNVRRTDITTGQSGSIKPGSRNVINYEDYYERPRQQQNQGGFGRGRGNSNLRFDWNSPLMISQHNHNKLFFGGNHLFMSLNRGEDWKIISPDLTLKEGKVPRAIVAIDESPLDPSVLWVGTNDGNVWVTKNDGVDWNQLNMNMPDVPKEYWVKRVEASNHEAGRAYVVFDGHRNDDIQPYVYTTDDFGQSWTKITNNLPEGSVYVIREDYKNPDLLFVGTSYSVFVSLNRGQSWTKFMNDLPTVPVHDLYIHPRDGDLIAGTHGRGAWVLDDITPLQEMTKENMEKSSVVFDIRPETLWNSPSGQYPYQSDKMFKGKNPERGPFVSYYINSGVGSAKIEITDLEGTNVFTADLKTESGLHKFKWERSFNPNERQIRMYKSSSNRMIDGFIRNASDKDKKALESYKTELENAGDDLTTLREVGQRMGTFLREYAQSTGARFRFRGGLRGNTARVGEYLVKVTIDGESTTKIMKLEKDNTSMIVR